MRIAIEGDGVSGRILYRLLKIRGIEADIYGREKHTECGIRPCGFGTSTACVRLIEKLGISPEKYVCYYFDYITINGRKMRGSVCGIDKPRLLEAIATDIRYDEPDIDSYDLIVDATGVDRRYGPSISQPVDKKAICYQHRVILRSDTALSFEIIRGGYLWTIPVSGREVHVGGGSTVLPPGELKQMVLDYLGRMKPEEILCSCSEPIRLSGPVFPMYDGKVVMVGESAGLVVPFGCAGIHPAVESAMMLADKIAEGDIAGYSRTIKRRFGWLKGAREIYDKLERGQVSFFSLGTAYQSVKYQGLKPALIDLLYIRRRMMEANK